MFTAANVSQKKTKKVDTCLGLPFQVSTNMSTLYWRFPGFPGECIATFFWDHWPKKKLTCLSSCNWGSWVSTLIWDMFAIFGGYTDSANNHSHISKSHPLSNTDTLSGRYPWPVIQPLVNATGFWNAPPIFLPTHEHHLWCALPEGVGTPFFSTVLLSVRSLIWALLGSGNKDAGASGAVVFWQFPGNPQRGGQLFH